MAATERFFPPYFACKGKPAEIRLCFHSSVLSDKQGHINDKQNAVRAVKFHYFNLWLDDSFLQSRENKPGVMNCCFMWSCGECRHVVYKREKKKGKINKSIGRCQVYFFSDFLRRGKTCMTLGSVMTTSRDASCKDCRLRFCGQNH